MPELSLAESIQMSLNAQEPWPDNVKLFQPYEVEQILLPDNASCLAVQAFLKMCNLSFEVEMRWNAEFMSPSGRVPFIKCGAFVVSELEPIVQFVANKGISLCSRLSTEEKAEMRAYMSLITNVLVNAELYVSWLDEDTYNTVTKIRNSSVYPWPLGWMQTRNKRSSVIKRLKALHWHEKTMDQVLADVEQCCTSLSHRLGDKDYFFGIPTPLDALIYGHVRALLSANGPQAPSFIKTLTTVLLRHVQRVANLIDTKLTIQEDFLITQAFKVSNLNALFNDSVMDRGDRLKKCKIDIEPIFKDCMFDAKDIFGFKPFASKQIVMMATKEGTIICEYHEQFERKSETVDQKTHSVVSGIIDEVIEKVDELSMVDLMEFKEKNDFEIIYPSTMGDINLDNVETSVNDFLDTIEEKDTTDSISQETDVEDVIRVINDSDHEAINDYVFSNDKKINYDNTEMLMILDDAKAEESMQMNPYSGMDYFRDKTIQREDKSFEDESIISKDSNETFKQKSPEERSIESLLMLLRKKNPAYEFLPTELDALVFGHVFTIITTRLPCRKLAETVRKHETLVTLAKRIDEKYFKRP